MARALKYTIPFASLDNTQYVVNVYVEGFTGTATTMTGAADPFTTSEKNDKEWLTVPVRTQTGYLRVVCEESEWRGLIPSSATSHYVELKKGNDIMWFGFIKPEAFTHSLYSGVDTYEFPLQCPLSVLDGMNLEWDDDHSTDTFATLLHRLLSLSGATFGNCYFTNNLANLFDDLLASSNLIQWYNDETRMVNSQIASAQMEEHYLTPSATALEIMQAICQFWGWECHLWGTDIYFTAHDEHTGYRKIPFADLTTLTTSYQMQLTAAGHISVEDAKYMTNRHQVEVGLPAREVKVKTDVNEVEDIMKIDIDAVAQFEELPLGWNYSSDQTRIIAKCQALRIDYDPAVEIPGMSVKFEGEQGLDDAIAQAMYTAGKGDFYGPVFQRISDFARDINPIPIKYDLSTYIFMLPTTGASTGETAKLTFETLAEYDFENCAISIHGDVFSNIAMSNNSLNAHLTAHVSIGDYYFNAISPSLVVGWVQQDSLCVIPIGSNSSDTDTSQNLTIRNISPANGATDIRTRWDTPYQGAEGYVIPVTTHIRGKLKISIEWEQDYYQNVIAASSPQYLRLSNFGVDIVRAQYANAVQRERTDSREYKQSISTDSSQDINVELRYATDNYNSYGTAFVCTKEGSYMKNMTYWTGDSERPEQHLLDRLVALYTTPTEWREIDVSDANVKYVTPRYTLKDVEGHYWWPVASSRNWVDGIVRITLGKMGSWTEPTGYYLADTWNVLLCDSTGKFLVIGDVPTPQPSLPTPTITPGSGEITLSQTITISISGDATSAEYSTDNETWTTYSAPFTLSADTTIYARATDGNGNYSDVASATYTVLPYDAQVEYLQSSGTQYIDTEIVIKQRNYELEMDMIWSGSTASTFETFFGFMATGSITPRCGFHKYQSNWMFGTNATTSSGVSVDSNRHTFVIKSYETNTEELYKDETMIKSGTNASNGLSSNTIPFYIFARNRNTSVDNKASAKLYFLKFTIYSDNDHTTASSSYDFIPVRIGTSGYMYDRVSKTLFGNAGTGDFTIGNDVN